MPIKIFFSHAWADKAGANLKILMNELKSNENYDVWLDRYEIKLSENIDSAVEDAIKDCDVFILAWSKNSSKNKHVLQELTIAKDYQKPIIPCIIDGFATDDSQLVKGLKWIEIKGNKKQDVPQIVFLNDYLLELQINRLRPKENDEEFNRQIGELKKKYTAAKDLLRELEDIHYRQKTSVSGNEGSDGYLQSAMKETLKVLDEQSKKNKTSEFFRIMVETSLKYPAPEDNDKKIQILVQTLIDLDPNKEDQEFQKFAQSGFELFKTNEAIISYYNQIEKQGADYLYEVKMLIVGEGGAGKTTLSCKIENPECPLPVIDDWTKGIRIKPLTFPFRDNPDKQIRLNVWDFGGQEMFHSTHRFFLSKRSIYVLVSDNRKDDTDFNYWLNIIETYAGDSPVIIVLNEKGDIPKIIDKSALYARYPERIKNILSVNFKTHEESDGKLKQDRLKKIKDLIRKIENTTQDLEQLGDPVAAGWIDVREALEKDPRNRIYREQFDEICNQFKITDELDINTLLEYFNDLGIILNFKDNSLLANVVMKPAWATEAVYKIFNNEKIKEKRGRFKKDDCRSIWNEKQYSNMHETLIELMKSFKLVYEIKKTGNLVAPQMLPNDTPAYDWDNKANSIMEYKFDNFMPKGILWEFIIRMYKYIKNHELVWKEGVILDREGKTFAETKESINYRRIYIKFSGEDIPVFRGIICDELDEICDSYHNLKYDKMLPCICSKCKNSETPHFFYYNTLKAKESRGKRTVDCDISDEAVNISDLLIGFKNKSKREGIDNRTGNTGNKRMLNVFISYSHAQTDEFKIFRNDFESFSKSIPGYELKVFEDFQIPIGSNWDKYLQEKVANCDIMILLVSQEFINSDYIRTKEFGKAIEDFKLGKNILIAPVYFAPSYFENDEDSKELQFFKPDGKDYGKLSLGKKFSYIDLTFNDTGTTNKNPYLKHYMKDFIDKLRPEIEKL